MMRTIVILVLILHDCSVSTTTTNVVRLDNLDVVVDGTNVTLTLRNGDKGIELLHSQTYQSNSWYGAILK